MTSSIALPRMTAPHRAAAPAMLHELQLLAGPWAEAVQAGLIEQWNDLAQSAVEPNPFYESWYLLPSLRVLDTAGEIQLLRLMDGDRLAGLMPLRRSARYYRRPLPHLANWVHANCFCGTPLVERGYERAFWHQLLLWADAHGGMAMFLHLEQLELGGPLHRALQQELAGTARRCGVVMREERAVLESALDPGAYRDQALSTSKRKAIRRKWRRLCEMGEACFTWQHDARDLPQWIEDFLRLEASGWKGRSQSAIACNAGTRSLFEQALTGAARQGKLVRLSLTLDGRPIAMLSNFAAGSALFGYKTAFDEAHARLSPGVLLENEFLEVLRRDDIAWCASCAAQGHPVMDAMWTGRRAVGSLSLAIGGTLRRNLFNPILRAETRRLEGRQ